MIRSARFSGALAGALLALGLLTAPVASAKPRSDEPFRFTCTEPGSTTAAADTADYEPGTHPSGKDRSAESGGSGTQGRSNSDPDGMNNGGSDKPDCERAYPYDQDDDPDGNNGCGNDADFEDDNNGNCGRKRQVDNGDDAAVTGFGVPDEAPEDDPAPADEPAPAHRPAPTVKAPAPAITTPAPVVDDPPPAEEEVKGPIVWGEEDPSNDPNPDDEYSNDDTPPTTEAPADPTGSPDMELAAHRDLAHTGGLLAAGLLAAGGVVFGGGRRALAIARRRLTD